MNRLRPPIQQRLARRCGSAMVLCFLAIAVLSMSAITLVRSHRRLNVRRSSISDAARGHAIAEGLLHREIAFRRNPGNEITTPGGVFRINTPVDVRLRDELNFSAATSLTVPTMPADGTMNVQVRLYPGAPPAEVRTRLSYQP